MIFQEKIKAFERKHPIGVYGLLLALLGLLATFWLGWPQNASIMYRVFSDTSVVDIKEEIPKLDVVFDGKSVRGQLRLITLRIENNGNKPITETDYSKDSPLGFKVTGGVILDRPTIIDASDESLLETRLSLTKDKAAVIGPVMLNRGDYILLKTLAVSDQGSNTVTIQPTGKIAGVSTIPVVLEYTHGVPSVLWWGTKWFLCILLLLVAYMVISLIISGNWVRILLIFDDLQRGRKYFKWMKKDVSRYVAFRGKSLRGVYKWLLEEGGRYGDGYLRSLQALLGDKETLWATFRRIQEGETTVETTIKATNGDDIWKVIGLRGIMRGIAGGLTFVEMKDTIDDFMHYYNTELHPTDYATSQKSDTPDED